MAQGDAISRRNLFRRSLGIRTPENEGGPKEPPPPPDLDNVSPDPAAAENASSEKIRKIMDVDPAERLRRLLGDEPAYADVYGMILKFCAEERSISEIECLLRANPALENPKIYPSYLIDRLEFAGALKWTGKWRVTETGKEKGAAL